MLSDYLAEPMIRLKVAAADWEEAVRAAGDLLVEGGCCTSGYIEAMIAAVHEIGPYMVLAPGLALAHARPEDGVLKVGISLVTLAEPVYFGSEVNDPVGLVIAFGSPDKAGHLEMLAGLATFLEDEDRRAALTRLAHPTEVLDALRAFEDA